MRDDVFHVDPLLGMFVDEAEGLGNQGIVDGGHFRRSPGHDAARRYEDPPLLQSPAPHQGIEHGRGVIADFPPAVDHRRQGRTGHFASDLLVVSGDDGDLLGDGDPGQPAGIQQLQGTEGVAGHDPRRPRQA